MSRETSHEAVVFDSVVVGGGAAGLSASLTLGRTRRRVLVLDTGLPRNRFAEHMHTVLGNEGTDPLQLVRTGRDEAAGYGVEFYDAEVLNVRDLSDRTDGIPQKLALHLAGGEEMITKSVVAASGLTDVLPEVPGLAELNLERSDTPAGHFLTVDQMGKTSHDRIWAAGNVASPMANVPMSISAGVMAGAAANMALVTEDFDLAEAAGPPHSFEAK